MEMTNKPLLRRVLSLLLAVCIAAGFVPLIDYSVFAAEPTATIGVIESGTPKSGSGWKWDGDSTLTLYGAKLNTTGEAQIIYNGTTPLTIDTIGYNYAEGKFPLIKSSTAVTVDGSGIIESDTTGNLFDCKVTIDGGFIKAENASAKSTIEFKDGYLDIGTISADNMKQTGGVVNCQTISGYYTIENGVLTVQTVVKDSEIMVNGGIVKAFNTSFLSSFNQTAGILMYFGSASVDSDMTNQGTIKIDNIDMNVYCKEVSDATAINASNNTSGVVYKNTGFFQINNNATLSGPVYIIGSIYGAYGTVKSGATVFCNSLDTDSALTLENGATMYCGQMNIRGCTINGSVYGRSSATINNSKIGATGSVYTGSNYWGYACQIDNIDDDGDNTTIDGSLTVYDGSVEFCEDTNPINGSITAYKKNGNAVTFKKSASLGDNAQLALYAPGNIYKAVYPSSTVNFDAAVYNSRRKMYSAQTLGDEYMATASVSSLHCGKAVYIGNDMGFRLDPTIKNSGNSSIFIGEDGSSITYAKEMPAVPTGESVKLYYDCTENIVLDDVNVTITKGGTDCTTNFDTSFSHYYKFSDDSETDDSEMRRSLCVEIKPNTTVEKGDYEVKVQYNGAVQTDTFKAKGLLELTLDFTAASGAWNYGGEFNGVNTDSSGSGWEWRSDTKQLILYKLNFETENILAIKVPGNTTIILRGENSLHSSSTAILCVDGDLTIIGEDAANGGSRGKLTATSEVLGQNEPLESLSHRCNAVIIALSGNGQHGNVTVKNADLNLQGEKGEDVSNSGQSNYQTAHCFGISGDTVKIDNSKLKIYTGTVSATAAGNLRSYCISADDNIILTGNTSLELESQGSAVISNPKDANSTKINSIPLSKLEGAAITLDDFNSTIKNNSYVYSGAITCTPDSEVKISTKPITQLDDAKTADVIDPDNGAYRVDLSQFFTGGTGDYIFEFDYIKPWWITLDSTKKILEINPHPGTIYTGGTLKMKVMDNDKSLRSPRLFDFTVGKVKAEVMLTVNYDDTLGTVTPATGKVFVGDNVDIRAEANDNAYIKSVMVEGGEVDLNNLPSVKRNKNGRIISGEYTIEDISGGYHIEVEFRELPTARVKVNYNENGFVTVATAPIDGKPDYTYYEGADVGLSVVAANGYRIKSAKLNGNEVNLTNGSYTIENITANCDFAVEFEALPTHKVTVSKTGSGTVTVETAAISGKPDYTFDEGADVVISVSAADGYRIKSVKLNGNEVILTNGKYTITNIAADCVFAVEFEEIPSYKVTVNKTGSGTVTVETAAISGKPDYTFDEGADVVISVSAADGYRIKSVKLNGNEVALTNGKYTIKNITADCTFAVEFEEIPSYKVTVNKTGNGTVKFITAVPSGKPENTYLEGTEVIFAVSADRGYKVSSVKLDGNAISASKGYYSFVISGDCTLDVTFAKVSSGGGSSIATPSDYEQLPSLNGVAMTWTEMTAALSGKTRDDKLVITISSANVVPESIVKVISERKLKAEFVYDSVKSWLVDGEKIQNVFAAEFTAASGSAAVGDERGILGIKLSMRDTKIPADLKLSFRKEYAGQFANLYRYSGGKLTFVSSGKIGEDGSAVLTGSESAGEYLVMVCEYSDIPGDVNNDGKVNALDASEVLRHIVGLIKATDLTFADLNNDGEVNALDAYEILIRAVGLKK